MRHSRAYGAASWVSLELEIDESLGERLSEQVSEARRAKDTGEVALMRAAAEASAAGHLFALRHAHPGMTERQLEIEVEAAFFRAGAERTAYGTIVGTGSNGAVLHFAPTDRVLRDGEVVLIDAGAEFGGYASDVTRTFPAGRRFEGAHRDLYELVLAVQQAAIAAAKPGVEYRELHLAACSQMAAGLVDLGLFKGSAQDPRRTRRPRTLLPARTGTHAGPFDPRRGGLPGRPGPERSLRAQVAPRRPPAPAGLRRHDRARHLFHKGTAR
ncbi:MAG: M24 family metallopeptidase [Dehalococcoidia bacterium]|nr:M24 family metallopeptidase [Dehalococcoidia bacterium]